MKKLLVSSVFCKNELDPYPERQSIWATIQTKFLNKTTTDFDYHIWNHKVPLTLKFKGEVLPAILPVVWDCEKNEWKEVEIEGRKHSFPSHTFTLDRILEYFRSNPYKNYLILDSDCFPIKDNWIDILLEKMDEYDYAAIVRCENLDTFPHPSAFFIKGSAIHKGLKFLPDKWSRNLLGKEIADTGSCIPMDRVFPLLRTNKWNPHPIFSGIYYDMFYHHCCGSTLKKTRATKDFGYYNSINNNEELLFNKLIENTDKFLGELNNGQIGICSY